MIKDLFEKYQIEYEKTVVPQSLLHIVKVDGIIDFLSCLGKDVKLNLSSYGVAHTLFYSVSNIEQENSNEYNQKCLDNGYLIVGNGANGDLLCINTSNGLVGYAFYDELWEGEYDTFSEIYVELPFTIEQFVGQALENKDRYPYDGCLAEKYMENHQKE